MLGIDLIVDVDDIAIIKVTDDLADSVAFTDVSEELVAETFTFTGTGHQTGDIYEFNKSRDDFLGLGDFCEFSQSFVRYFNGADVRFDGAEGVVFGGYLFLGESIEEGGFANIR